MHHFSINFVKCLSVSPAFSLDFKKIVIIVTALHTITVDNVLTFSMCCVEGLKDSSTFRDRAFFHSLAHVT